MQKLFFILLTTFLVSCNSKHESLTVTFDRSNGLKAGNQVLINDFQIGVVTNISLNPEYKINAEIELNDTIRLPKDSQFTIQSNDFYTKSIVVTPGSSRSYLTSSDKIEGKIAEGLKLDSLFDKISEEINNSKPLRNQDSIISGLNDLKRELKVTNAKK